MLWDDWYRQLEQLPNESAEWNEIEAFIKRIQNLCEDRKRQQSQDTQALNSALSRLRDQFLSDLMFFQLDMVVEWLEHGVIFINHRAACDALMAMAQSFDEYHESKQKPVSTVVDDRRKREGLATLESHITQLSAFRDCGGRTRNNFDRRGRYDTVGC